jgi:hypothetical protein
MGRTALGGMALLAAVTVVSAIIAWNASSRAAELEHAFLRGATDPRVQMRLDELESRNRILEDLLDATEPPAALGSLAAPGAPSIRSYYSRPRGLPGDVRSPRPPPPPTRESAELPPCACAHCRYEAARAERLRSL